MRTINFALQQTCSKSFLPFFVHKLFFELKIRVIKCLTFFYSFFWIVNVLFFKNSYFCFFNFRVGNYKSRSFLTQHFKLALYTAISCAPDDIRLSSRMERLCRFLMPTNIALYFKRFDYRVITDATVDTFKSRLARCP